MREDLDNVIASFLGDARQLLLFALHLLGAHHVLWWDSVVAPCPVVGCGWLIVIVEEALAIGVIL